MGALTTHVPKPMLTIAGKNLIEHKLAVLPPEIDEVILVVGYLREVIESHFGSTYGGRKIRYVLQENIVGGTADALWQAKEVLHGRFVVMMGDDIYTEADVRACLAAPEWALLTHDMHETRSAGEVMVGDAGEILSIEEGEHSGSWRACTNLFVLDTRIFGFDPVPKAHGSSELGLPQTVLWARQSLGISLRAIPDTGWIQITEAADLASAETILSSRGLLTP